MDPIIQYVYLVIWGTIFAIVMTPAHHLIRLWSIKWLRLAFKFYVYWIFVAMLLTVWA